MSDITAASSQPSRATVAKHSIPVIVWVVVVLAAAAAFGGAVMLSGGVNEALNVVGLGSLTGASSQSSTPQNTTSNSAKPKGGAPVSGATTSSATPTATTAPAATGSATAAATGNPNLPTSVRTAMYREQLQSQVSIKKLVDDKVASMSLGTSSQSGNTATVPVKVKYRDGSTLSGVMTLKKYSDKWYFFSLSAAQRVGSVGTTPRRTIDQSVISAITRQQATPGNQDMVKVGIIGGGYKTVTVKSVKKGAGTATISVRLSGGKSRARDGQFVAISKRSGSTTNWFLARFVAK